MRSTATRCARSARARLALLALLGAAMAASPERARAGDATRDPKLAPWTLLDRTARVMTKLKADLEMPSAAWQLLAIGAQELVDPETKLPFRTKKDNPLLYWSFGPHGARGPTGATETVLFVGGMHADEVHAIHASFRALFAIAQEPLRRPADTRVIFVPLLNPDGLLAVEASPTAAFGTRKNANGVDLNRNFLDASPESETRFLKALIARHAPSHIVALHGPFGWLDYDGPADDPAAPRELREHRDAWTSRIAAAGRLTLPVHEDGKVREGSLGTWAGASKRLHVLTIELPGLQGPATCAGQWSNYGETVLASLDVPPRT